MIPVGVSVYVSAHRNRTASVNEALSLHKWKSLITGASEHRRNRWNFANAGRATWMVFAWIRDITGVGRSVNRVTLPGPRISDGIRRTFRREVSDGMIIVPRRAGIRLRID